MPDVTMLEAAKHHQDELERTVAKIIVESSPILEYLPMKTIVGAALRYHREGSLGTVAFRGVNGTYTPDAGVIVPEFEPLVIMGGEVKIDNFEVAVMGNIIPIKAEKFRMKARAAGIKYSESFFEGDTVVDPYSFDGLRKRLVGAQLVTGAGANGDALALAQLDELLDVVVGDNSQKVLFMSARIRRALTALVRAQTGSSMISYTQDAFGRQQMAYAGATIRVVRREDDGSTILGNDETKGSSNVTSSVYCVRFGTDFVHGIQHQSLPSVKDFGEMQAEPKHLGRIEWYNGLVAGKHPRGAARLYGITN